VIDPEPVELFLERQCSYKRKAKREGQKCAAGGCARCDLAKVHPNHLGGPPSLNEGGSGMNRRAYQALKGAWEDALEGELVKSGLPRGLESVRVQVMIGFSEYIGRDEDNFKWMLSKALGDTLTRGGWLEEDTFWPIRRYSMGDLEGRHTPGESWTRLLIFGSFIPPIPDPRAVKPKRTRRAARSVVEQDSLL
jgi:hypothetical protein